MEQHSDAAGCDDGPRTSPRPADSGSGDEGSDEGNPGSGPLARRWCNFMYTARCPYKVGVNVEQCKFVHMDQYVRMPAGEREMLAMPSIMLKHMRGLGKEMKRIVDARARQVLDLWNIDRAWSGWAEGVVPSQNTISPYGEAKQELGRLGWVLPESPSHTTPRAALDRGPPGSTSRLEDAQYADDVAAILSLCACVVHYNLRSAPPIVIDTMCWVFGLEIPKMNQARGTRGGEGEGEDVPDTCEVLTSLSDTERDPALLDGPVRAKDSKHANRADAPDTTDPTSGGGGGKKAGKSTAQRPCHSQSSKKAKVLRGKPKLLVPCVPSSQPVAFVPPQWQTNDTSSSHVMGNSLWLPSTDK